MLISAITPIIILRKRIKFALNRKRAQKQRGGGIHARKSADFSKITVVTHSDYQKQGTMSHVSSFMSSNTFNKSLKQKQSSLIITENGKVFCSSSGTSNIKTSDEICIIPNAFQNKNNTCMRFC